MVHGIQWEVFCRINSREVPGSEVDSFQGAKEEETMIICRVTLSPGGDEIRYMDSGRVELGGRTNQAEGKRLCCRYKHSKRKNHTKTFGELSPYWLITNPHHFISHFKDFSSTNHPNLFVTLLPLSTESFQHTL